MKNEIKEIKFIEYNGIKGYIELMKHDVEPLNNPECKNIELYYNGKDIKSVLDYITNLQEGNYNLLQEIEDMQNKNNKLIEENKELYESIEKAICYLANCDWNNKEFYDLYEILIGEDKDE